MSIPLFLIYLFSLIICTSTYPIQHQNDKELLISKIQITTEFDKPNRREVSRGLTYALRYPSKLENPSKAKFVVSLDNVNMFFPDGKINFMIDIVSINSSQLYLNLTTKTF